MEIEKIKIDDIQVASYNPRIIDDDELKKLMNSIETFGLVDPIIINNKTNTIIGGHQRLKALKSICYDKELNKINLGGISWIFGDDIKELSELEEKALNIALNKISGDWDTEKLEELLEELELENFNTNLTGFDNEEIDFIKLENDIIYHDVNSLYELEKEKEIENEEDIINNDNDNNNINSIIILFKDEDELNKEFNKLVQKGYNCRMTKS